MEPQCEVQAGRVPDFRFFTGFGGRMVEALGLQIEEARQSKEQ